MRKILIIVAIVAAIVWLGSLGPDGSASQVAQAEIAPTVRSTSEPAPAAQMNAPSAWRMNVTQSGMTDQTNVVLTAVSDTPVQCSWGGGYLTLTARCVENTTALVISGDCHMTSSVYDNSGTVTYRLDDASPATWQMDAATNSRALGLWRGGQSIAQIQRMLGKDTLRVRVQPFGQNAVETTFDISGLNEIIGPLRRACHW